jgi:hypothetical protein
MAFHMAQIGVLQRHIEPSEGHHLGTVLNMQVIQLRLAEGLAGARRIPHSLVGSSRSYGCDWNIGSQ